MSFARLHKVVTYLFAALGLFAISLGPYLTLTSELVIAATVVGSWFVEGERVRDPRWVRGWTVGLFIFLGVQILRGFTGGSILELALEFTAALQVSRLFNRRTAKEHQQIAAIALLQLVAATVLSTDLSYAFAFLGFVLVAPWTLSLGHLREEIEGQVAGEDEEREKTTQRVLQSKRLVGPAFLITTAGLALPLFLMTGVLFIVFPRVGLGFLSFGEGMGQRVSGFGANVELGDFGVIRTDPTVVLRVTPPNLPETPPPSVSIRMRGTSFDTYDGRRWTRGGELESQSIGRVGTHYAVPVRMPSPHHDQAWEVVLDPLDESVLFLPPNTVGLRVPPRITGGLEVGRSIMLSPGLDIRYADADGLGLRYTAYTADDAHDDDQLTPAERERYLRVPSEHEPVAALAREWTVGETTDRGRVRALVAHLRDSDDFRYSLEMPRVEDDEQPVVVFLTSARSGHCEYYSTALALLLRSQGIPTRNVTGFLGGRYNEYGGYYALSQGDAHSWVEAYFDGRWHVLEATPPARDAIAPDDGWLSTVQAALDAIRTRWTNDVVGYDLRSQFQLFRALRRYLGSERDVEQPDAPRDSSSVGVGTPSWVWLLLLLVAGGLVWLARWLWRRRGTRRGPPEGAVALYAQLDGTLAALGWPRQSSQTPGERVRVLEAEGFGALRLVRDVTERYLAVRYGGERLAEGELARWRTEMKALRKRRDLRRAPQKTA